MGRPQNYGSSNQIRGGYSGGSRPRNEGSFNGGFGGGYGGGAFIEILKDEREGPVDGVYNFLYETSDGVTRQEQGQPSGPYNTVVQQGGWS